MKRRRALAIAAGTCPRCFVRPAANGRKDCHVCATTKAAALVVYRKAWASAPDRCFDCGRRIPRMAKIRCEACLAANRVQKNRTRERRRKDGLCPWCGRPPPEPGNRVCPACLEDHYHRRVMRMGG